MTACNGIIVFSFVLFSRISLFSERGDEGWKDSITGFSRYQYSFFLHCTTQTLQERAISHITANIALLSSDVIDLH